MDRAGYLGAKKKLINLITGFGSTVKVVIIDEFSLEIAMDLFWFSQQTICKCYILHYSPTRASIAGDIPL